MTLFVCADCAGNVSSSAMDCVHCGNILQTNQPGTLGTMIRIFYAIFCLVMILIGMGAIADAANSTRPSDALMVPVIIFGIWFAGSVSVATLFYVTRNGRIVRVDGAVQSSAGETLEGGTKKEGWAHQGR